MRLLCAACWIALGGLVSGLGAAAWVITNMSARPLPKPADGLRSDRECRLVAQIEAQRQQAVTLGQTPLRGVAYVTPVLRGEPAPWRIQPDDNIETRLRLWATSFQRSKPRPPLDCAKTFSEAGLSIDLGEALRPEATAVEWVQVATYSRAWVSPRSQWVLVRSQHCEPSKRATNASVTKLTSMHEYLGGSWIPVATDSRSTTLELRYFPSPSRCPAPMN